MNETNKKRIKSLRRLEIRNTISDIRYLLDFAVMYGSGGVSGMIFDKKHAVKKMFKVRNDFSFLGGK